MTLHYIEGFPDIGGLSFAQLWKMPLLMLLICYFIFYLKRLEKFEKWTIFLLLESFFCIETFINPLSNIISAAKLLPFILFFHYFVNRGFSIVLLKRVALFMARAICLTSLISLLGIVNPIEKYKEALVFGIEDLSYYSSLFGSPHAASSYFAIAIVVLLYFVVKEKYVSKIGVLFDCIMIGIALLSIFKVCVRTGWLMLAVGLFFLAGGIKLFKKPKYFVAFWISVALLCILFNNNEMFHARMTGLNIYRGTGGETIDLNGSGRVDFWKNGIELWANGSPYEILFGRGYTAVVENNSLRTGIDVFSHSQFIDTLTQHGLIGLILLLICFLWQYIFIRKRKYSQYYRLCLSIYMMSLVFSFFQNVMYFDFAIIYSVCLAMLANDMTLKKVSKF